MQHYESTGASFADIVSGEIENEKNRKKAYLSEQQQLSLGNTFLSNNHYQQKGEGFSNMYLHKNDENDLSDNHPVDIIDASVGYSDSESSGLEFSHSDYAAFRTLENKFLTNLNGKLSSSKEKTLPLSNAYTTSDTRVFGRRSYPSMNVGGNISTQSLDSKIAPFGNIPLRRGSFKNETNLSSPNISECPKRFVKRRSLAYTNSNNIDNTDDLKDNYRNRDTINDYSWETAADSSTGLSKEGTHRLRSSATHSESSNKQTESKIKELIKENIFLVREVERLKDDIDTLEKNKEELKESLMLSMTDKHERRVRLIKEEFDFKLVEEQDKNKELLIKIEKSTEVSLEKTRILEERIHELELASRLAEEKSKNEQRQVETLSQQNNALEEQISAALNTVSQFSEKHLGLGREIDHLQKDIHIKERLIETKTYEVDTLTKEIESLKKNILIKETDINVLNKTVEKQSEELIISNQTIQQVQDELKLLKDSVKLNKHKFKKQQLLYEELTTETKNNQKKNELQQVEINHLKQQTSEYHSIAKSSWDESQSKQHEIELLRERLQQQDTTTRRLKDLAVKYLELSNKTESIQNEKGYFINKHNKSCLNDPFNHIINKENNNQLQSDIPNKQYASLRPPTIIDDIINKKISMEHPTIPIMCHPTEENNSSTDLESGSLYANTQYISSSYRDTHTKNSKSNNHPLPMIPSWQLVTTSGTTDSTDDTTASLSQDIRSDPIKNVSAFMKSIDTPPPHTLFWLNKQKNIPLQHHEKSDMNLQTKSTHSQSHIINTSYTSESIQPINTQEISEPIVDQHSTPSYPHLTSTSNNSMSQNYIFQSNNTITDLDDVVSKRSIPNQSIYLNSKEITMPPGIHHPSVCPPLLYSSSNDVDAGDDDDRLRRKVSTSFDLNTHQVEACLLLPHISSIDSQKKNLIENKNKCVQKNTTHSIILPNFQDSIMSIPLSNKQSNFIPSPSSTTSSSVVSSNNLLNETNHFKRNNDSTTQTVLHHHPCYSQYLHQTTLQEMSKQDQQDDGSCASMNSPVSSNLKSPNTTSNHSASSEHTNEIHHESCRRQVARLIKVCSSEGYCRYELQTCAASNYE